VARRMQGWGTRKTLILCGVIGWALVMGSVFLSEVWEYYQINYYQRVAESRAIMIGILIRLILWCIPVTCVLAVYITAVCLLVENLRTFIVNPRGTPPAGPPPPPLRRTP